VPDSSHRPEEGDIVIPCVDDKCDSLADDLYTSFFLLIVEEGVDDGEAIRPTCSPRMPG